MIPTELKAFLKKKFLTFFLVPNTTISFHNVSVNIAYSTTVVDTRLFYSSTLLANLFRLFIWIFYFHYVHVVQKYLSASLFSYWKECFSEQTSNNWRNLFVCGCWFVRMENRERKKTGWTVNIGNRHKKAQKQNIQKTLPHLLMVYTNTNTVPLNFPRPGTEKNRRTTSKTNEQIDRRFAKLSKCKRVIPKL